MKRAGWPKDKERYLKKYAILLNGVAYPIHGCYGEKGVFCITGKNKIGLLQ